MKTTIEIADALFEEAKAKAAREKTTLRALVEEGLRKVLAEPEPKPFKLRDGSFGSGGLHPDVAHLPMSEVIKRSYGSRGGYPEWD